jgi:hypothetical protein
LGTAKQQTNNFRGLSEKTNKKPEWDCCDDRTDDEGLLQIREVEQVHTMRFASNPLKKKKKKKTSLGGWLLLQFSIYRRRRRSSSNVWSSLQIEL